MATIFICHGHQPLIGLLLVDDASTWPLLRAWGSRWGPVLKCGSSGAVQDQHVQRRLGLDPLTAKQGGGMLQPRMVDCQDSAPLPLVPDRVHVVRCLVGVE